MGENTFPAPDGTPVNRQGPDADRHAKLLIVREAEGSLLEAYLQIGTRFGRFATGVSEITITPEGLLCGDPWRTWRSPPPGETVPNLSDWRRANWDHIRVPVTWLFVPAQAARRAHCWLRKCILPAGKPDCRAIAFSAHDDAMS